MVPLVPALVMLGLVAGAHGDSKSDPFGAGRWGALLANFGLEDRT